MAEQQHAILHFLRLGLNLVESLVQMYTARR